MYMEIIFLKHFRKNFVFLPHRTHIAHANLRGFLHHFAHPPGKLYFPFPGHHIHFNLQGVPAYASPGKPTDNAYLGFFIGFIQGILSLAQVFIQIGGGHFHLFRFLPLFPGFQDLFGGFSADIPDFPFQLPYPGLLGIISNDILQGTVLKGKHFPGDAVGFHLFFQ